MRSVKYYYNGFRIGHSAYTGANRLEIHCSYGAALADLLRRKVSMLNAHKALQSAINGTHATAPIIKQSKINPGYFYTSEVVEVVCLMY